MFINRFNQCYRFLYEQLNRLGNTCFGSVLRPCLPLNHGIYILRAHKWSMQPHVNIAIMASLAPCAMFFASFMYWRFLQKRTRARAIMAQNKRKRKRMALSRRRELEELRDARMAAQIRTSEEMSQMAMAFAAMGSIIFSTCVERIIGARPRLVYHL